MRNAAFACAYLLAVFILSSAGCGGPLSADRAFGGPPGALAIHTVPEDMRTDLMFLSSLVLGRPGESASAGRRIAWFDVVGEQFKEQRDYPECDYAAMMNKRLSAGVTADNNAAAAIAQAIGPALFPEHARATVARGLGLTWPAGASYLDAARGDLEKIFAVGGDPWKAQDHPAADKWLKANTVGLDAIVAACRRPRFYVPVVLPADGPLTTETMYFRPDGLKWAGVALIMRANLAIGERQDFAGAWADILAVHRLGRLLMGEGSGVGAVTGLVLTELADDCTQELVMEHAFGRQTLERMLADLQALPDLLDAGGRMGEWDRFVMLDAIGKAAGAGADRDRAAKVLRPALAMLFRRDRAALDRATKAVAEGLAADRQGVERRLNGFYDLVAEVPLDGEGFLAYMEEHRAARVPPGDKDKAGWAGSVLIAAAAWWLEEVEPMRKRFEARHRLSVLAAALALHKARQGAYPPALAALSPAVLPGAVPNDPFADAPFRYRLHKDGEVELYGVGPNGADDAREGDDMNCGGGIVLVVPPRPPIEITPELLEAMDSIGPVRGRFFGSGGSTSSLVYVIAPAGWDAGTLQALRSELRGSVSRLSRDQRFALVSAADGRPAVGPAAELTPATDEMKKAALKAIDSLKPDPNGDILAALKRACELLETDKPSTKTGRPVKWWLVYLLCPADPSEAVAKFVEARPKDAPVKIMVNVVLFGPEGMPTTNAGRIAGGRFKVVGPPAATQPGTP